MNILITGSNGFIGRNLSKQLEKKYGHKITTINRSNCDLLDYESVRRFFIDKNQSYDLVLHTAVEGGRRNKIDTKEMAFNNLLMLYNLLTHQGYYQCIVSFGSGAELDRRYDINERSINRYPIDPYGLSKSIIDKLRATESKLCNFRIFNCFGIDEQPDRMIRANITKYLNRQDIIVHQDRKMDFFYIDDLATLINSFIKHNHVPKEFDCCYAEKYTLLEISNMINEIDTHRVNIKLLEDQTQTNPINTMEKDYIGLPAKINIDYIGLKKALKIMYDSYKGQS